MDQSASNTVSTSMSNHRMDVPIGVLVDVVAGRIPLPTTTPPNTAYQTLLHIGIKVDMDAMYVSNTARDIQTSFKRHAVGHMVTARVLKRLPGASATMQIRCLLGIHGLFPGQRGYLFESIPLRPKSSVFNAILTLRFTKLTVIYRH